jgi:hypothetical protein
METAEVAYKELAEVEKDVVIVGETDDVAMDPPEDPVADGSVSKRLIVKTIKKPIVEVLCSQHNRVCLCLSETLTHS